MDQKKGEMTLLERAYELQVQMDLNRTKRELMDKAEVNVKEIMKENIEDIKNAKNPHE